MPPHQTCFVCVLCACVRRQHFRCKNSKTAEAAARVTGAFAGSTTGARGRVKSWCLTSESLPCVVLCCVVCGALQTLAQQRRMHNGYAVGITQVTKRLSAMLESLQRHIANGCVCVCGLERCLTLRSCVPTRDLTKAGCVACAALRQLSLWTFLHSATIARRGLGGACIVHSCIALAHGAGGALLCCDPCELRGVDLARWGVCVCMRACVCVCV